MMLFIPVVGTKFTLTSDFTFTLYPECRNENLFDIFDPDYKYWEKGKHSYNPEWRKNGGGKPMTVTLPMGAELTVDRVYIRKGNSSDFNSVSFYIKKSPILGKKKSARFWVKIDELNGKMNTDLN